MSMDAAVTRMPLCPICEKRVDENATEYSYYIVDGDHYHAKCWREVQQADQDDEDYQRAVEAELP